jgi:hypothetical protein
VAALAGTAFSLLAVAPLAVLAALALLAAMVE